MAISQNFPDEGPTLNLNFAGSRTLDPRITFTRTSNGTYTDDNGLIRVAPTNAPRFDHRYVNGEIESLGLLIEESRTNLVTYSEQFNDASWTKSNAGITTNTTATTAPDGTNSAEKLVENTANSLHYVEKTISGTTNTNPYTFSVFVKSAERTYVNIRILEGSPFTRSSNVNFNLTTGVIFGTVSDAGGAVNISASIASYPNNWYRISLISTLGGSASSIFAGIFLADGTGGNITYTGDGTSGLFIWGAQLEAGAFPTSYIPTVASTVTRSVDNASMTGSNFSDFYNQSEGTLGFIGDTISPSSYSPIYQIDDGGTENRLYLDKNIFGSGRVVSTVSGSNQCLITLSTISSNIPFRLYGAYKLNNCAASLNGGTVGTDTSATMPTCNMSRIGTDGVNYINGHIAQLTYYPTRLTNSQLVTLTR